MTGLLRGKTAVITGATGAIVVASAKLLARDGAKLVLMALRQNGLDKAASQIREVVSGASIACIVADCSEETALMAGLEEAYSICGRLDVLFATVGGGGFKPFMMLDAQAMRDAFEANVISSFLAIRYSASKMERGGSIILLSSTAAHMPFAYLGPYHVAKAGVEALMRAAAEELAGSGIRVNAIRPGMTRSTGTGSMFDNPEALAPFLAEYPLGRLGEPEDIAGAVRFLAGPESSWMTGQSIAVDGGDELRKNPDLTPMVEAIFGVEAVTAARAARPL